MKYLKFLIFVILSLGNNYGQMDNTKPISDSLKLYSEVKLKLNNNYNPISPLFAIKQPIIFEDYSQFYFPNFEQNLLDKPVSIIQLNRELKETMIIYRRGTIKNDLGFIGEILGYTNAAAAVGLAIYHVSKYPKKYGIK